MFLNVLFFYAFIVMQLIQSCKEFHLPTIRLGHVTRKTVSEMTYNVSSGTLNSTILHHTYNSVTVLKVYFLMSSRLRFLNNLLECPLLPSLSNLNKNSHLSTFSFSFFFCIKSLLPGQSETFQSLYVRQMFISSIILVALL